MHIKKTLIPLLACALLSLACNYIVIPECWEAARRAKGAGWSAVATEVGSSETGNLRITLTLRNDTGDWSAMQAAAKPAALVADGKTTPCDTVFVSSGGHRLAPGFQMRGYIAGTQADQQIQLIYVECQGAAAAPGAVLAVEYSYVTGQYNYYEPEANKTDGKLEIPLDNIASGLTYPIGEPVEGLIQQENVEIVALNKVVLTLAGVERTADGFQFSWKTANPGEYPTYVHVGNPPVIGADGILYGFYETPDLASVPITPAGGESTWTTTVAVPQDAQGLYILLSAESGKQRLYANYALDITGR